MMKTILCKQIKPSWARRQLMTLAVILVGSMAFGAFAQGKCPGRRPDPKMWKEIQEYKMKFLAQEMDLPKDKQQKFFDLYSEMSEKKRKLFDDVKCCEMALEKDENASDKDYEDAFRKLTAAKEKDAALEKEYDKKFSKILTSRQIYKMKQGEEKFRRKMARMHHKHHSGKNARGVRPKQK